MKNSEKPLIVGIDPGVTTGVVIFDLDGELVSVSSKKSLSKSDISSFVSKFGKPAIVASDVSLPPKLLEKIASAFGAKLVFPKNSFSRKEKAKIARAYQKFYGKMWKNIHERDALVAGYYCWKKIRPRILKLESKLKKLGINDENLIQTIKKKVIIEEKKLKCVIDDLGLGAVK